MYNDINMCFSALQKVHGKYVSWNNQAWFQEISAFNKLTRRCCFPHHIAYYNYAYILICWLKVFLKINICFRYFHGAMFICYQGFPYQCQYIHVFSCYKWKSTWLLNLSNLFFYLLSCYCIIVLKMNFSIPEKSPFPWWDESPMADSSSSQDGSSV